MAFNFSSESCLSAAEDILSAADAIGELLELFNQAKESILANYTSEAASAIQTAFETLQKNGPAFHEAVELCSKYLSDTVAPSYASVEKAASDVVS